MSPAEVLAVPLTDLRAAGLSGQKAAYITDLAAHYADGRLTDAALQGAHSTDRPAWCCVICVSHIQLCSWLGLHSA